MSKRTLSGKALVIQIDQDHIHLAQTVLGTAWPQLSDTRVLDTPSGAVDDGELLNISVVSAALDTVLSEPEYRHIKQVVFSLCTTRVISEKVSVPRISGQKLEALLAANLDMYFPVNVQDYHIVYEQAGYASGKNGSQEQLLQLWATPKSLLQRYYTLANELGLSVVNVDWFGHSLVTAVGATFAEASLDTGKKKSRSKSSAKATTEPEPLTDVVEPYFNYEADLSADPAASAQTTLYLLAEPEALLMTFTQNGRVALQRLLDRNSISDELAEAQLVMDYYQSMSDSHKGPIQGLLVGSDPELSEYAGRLSEELDIPVRILSAEYLPEWYVCAGAAGATLDFGSIDFNTISQPKAQVRQLWQYVLIAIGGVAVIGIVLYTLISRATWNMDISSKQAQQTSLLMQIEQETSRYRDVREAYDEYVIEYSDYSVAYDNMEADQQAVLDTVRTYNGNLVLMLLELESVLPEGTAVRTIGIGDEGLGLEFACASKTEAAYLIQALRDLQFATLADVSRLSLTRDSDTTGYSMLLSLNEILMQEQLAAQEQAALEQAVQEQAPAEAAEQEQAEDYELPPLEGSAVSTDGRADPSNYPMEDRMSLLRGLIEEDDRTWELFIDLLASRDTSEFMDLFGLSRYENPLQFFDHPAFENMDDDEREVAYFEVFDIYGNKSDIGDAIRSHDSAALDEYLNPHRGLIAALSTSDEDTFLNVEILIEDAPELYDHYAAKLDEAYNTPSPTPIPTPTPTSEETPTPPPTSTPAPVQTPKPREWDKYPIEQRKSVASKLIKEDDKAWSLLITELTVHDPEYFIDLVRSYSDPSKLLSNPGLILNLTALLRSSDEIQEAIRTNNSVRLNELLSPYRDLLAVLLTSDDVVFGYLEDMIADLPQLSSYYLEQLEKSTTEPTPTPTPAPNTTPKPTPTPTPSNLTEQQVQELLKQWGLIDENGRPTSGNSNGGSSSGGDGSGGGGVADGDSDRGLGIAGTMDGEEIIEPVYFSVVLRYKDELIQKELLSKETPITLPDKLTPIGSDVNQEDIYGLGW